MNLDDIAAQIAALARKFRTLANVSISSLLKTTGYLQVYDQISQAEIRAALVRCPECSEEWIQYSEDKRTNGWYITQDDDGRYEVGYVAEDGHRNRQRHYNDRIDACASFIKHEIEDIRRLM